MPQISKLKVQQAKLKVQQTRKLIKFENLAGFVTRAKREAHAKRAIQQKHTLSLQYALRARSERAKRAVLR